MEHFLLGLYGGHDPVFMLNMTCDVPVKLLSFHIFLVAFFSLQPDLRRIIHFFFLKRAAEHLRQPAIFDTRCANWIAFAQLLFGLWLLGMNAYGSHVNWLEYGGDVPSRPFTAFGRWTSNLWTGSCAPLTNSGVGAALSLIFLLLYPFQRIDDSFVTCGVFIDVKNDTLVLGSGSSI